MAVVSAYPMQVTGGGNVSGDSFCTVRWIVKTDSRSDGFKTVLAASQLPRRGQTYEFGNESDGSLFAQDSKATYVSEQDSLMLWYVDVTYSTAGLTTDPEQQKGDPLDWRPIISTYSQKVRRPVLKDINDRLIASSAGAPYDPVQERDETKFFLRIVRNVATHNPAFNATYKDNINRTLFWGCEPGTVKVEVPGIATQKFAANGQRYYEETWEFAIEPNGWDLKLYDYGMYRLVNNGAGNVRETITDSNNRYLTEPALLNGAGAVLAVGAPPVFLEPFQLYERSNFDALRLPRSFGDS